MTYEELLIESDDQNLIVKEKIIPGYKGRIYKNRVAIRRNMPDIEKSCVLAEELGHYYTTVGNILDQGKVENRKQEFRARTWAYNKQIGLLGIISAYKHGCTNHHEASEYLGVTEEFFQEAINCYRAKYGVYVSVDNYIIFFEPSLAVMQKIK